MHGSLVAVVGAVGVSVSGHV